MKDKVITCLSTALSQDREAVCALPDDTDLTEQGMDSIRFIAFIVQIEETFHIEIRDSDLTPDRFKTIALIMKTLDTYLSPAPKCLILDADNVLWRGISGEETTVVDETATAFQELLLHLYQQGVLLCLCSKNDEKWILESFSNPAMRLQPAHFVIFSANLKNKADRIAAMAEELNLSVDQFLFVDDSDYELGLVTHVLPSLHTLKIDYGLPAFIKEIKARFAHVQPTMDLNRTQLYKEQKAREKEKSNAASIGEYNATLQTNITCRPAEAADCPRLAELSARTNQCNLSAKHYTKEELQAMLAEPTHTVLSLSVQDKFGDMGIVGMAIVRERTIETFMLSCRAFDRGLEAYLINEVKKLPTPPQYGIYCDNGKNTRYATFYEEHGIKTK